MEWSKFIVFENAAEKGKAFQPHGSFAGWADYLVIPNRQAVANSVQFFTRQPFMANQGFYRLKLVAHAGSGVKSKAIAAAEIEFEITEAQAEKLLCTRVSPETRISSSSVQFRSAHV